MWLCFEDLGEETQAAVRRISKDSKKIQVLYNINFLDDKQELVVRHLSHELMHRVMDAQHEELKVKDKLKSYAEEIESTVHDNRKALDQSFNELFRVVRDENQERKLKVLEPLSHIESFFRDYKATSTTKSWTLLSGYWLSNWNTMNT